MIESLLGLVLIVTLSGTDHVCVPSREGGWLCGDDSSPPAPASLPPKPVNRVSNAPPVLLIDPKRLEFGGELQTANEPVLASEEAQSSIPVPADVPEQSEPESSESRPSTTAPASAQSVPARSSAAPSQAASETSVRATGLPEKRSDDAVEASISNARVNPREERELVAGTRKATVIAQRGATRFAAQDFIVQLAIARSQRGFAPMLKRLGVLSARAEILPIRREGEAWFVLCLGPFDSLAQARAAIPLGAVGAFARPLSDFKP